MNVISADLRRAPDAEQPDVDRLPPESVDASKTGAVVSRVAPWTLVAVAVVYGLVTLRTELVSTAYPNDEAVHSLMVQFAMQQWQAGHLPFSAWFPYLSLGSPYLLHYQSTPAVITGLLATVFGAQTAFGWTMYLLLATWPVSVYLGARLFGFDRWTAAIAASMAPLLSSIEYYGFGPQAYIWIGNGLWSQEWGMWMLPLCLGLTWQAVSQGRRRLAAGASLAAIIAFHFLTAYLAGLLIVCWVVIRPTQFVVRLRRAAAVVAIGVFGSAFVTVPLLVFGGWAAANELQTNTFWNNSYGARQVLSWLARGQLFDNGRLPIVTVFAAIGLLVTVARARRTESARALLAIFGVSLILFFGKTTFGALFDILPFESQLLLHRYVMGVQLGGLYLAGTGLHFVGKYAVMWVRARASVVRGRFGWHEPNRPLARSALSVVGSFSAVAVIVALLIPAWRQIASFEYDSAYDIRVQQVVDTTEGADINTLASEAEAIGPGRIYAGLPSNWGGTFVVGQVPVYIYLVDGGYPCIGFTERTSSLMSGPEAFFDEANPGDYRLFGVHYLLLPLNHAPPVPAHLVARAGNAALWTVGVPGYVQVVDTSGTIAANASDLGGATYSFLRSVTTAPDYPTIAYNGRPAAPGTLALGQAERGLPGRVLQESDDLKQGQISAVVTADRPAVVLLKASYDPGWTATVDGKPTVTEMVAPALLGVEVSAGTHRVQFAYVPYSKMPLLIALSGATFVVAWALPFSRRRRHRARPDVAVGESSRATA